MKSFNKKHLTFYYIQSNLFLDTKKVLTNWRIKGSMALVTSVGWYSNFSCLCDSRKITLQKKRKLFVTFFRLLLKLGFLFIYLFFLLLLLCNAVIHRRCFCSISISRISNIKGVKAQRRGWDMRFENLWKKQIKDGRVQRWKILVTKEDRNTLAKKISAEMQKRGHIRCGLHISAVSYILSGAESVRRVKSWPKRKADQINDFSFSYKTHHSKPNGVNIIIFFTEDCTLAKESWSPPSGQLKYRTMSNFNFLNF